MKNQLEPQLDVMSPSCSPSALSPCFSDTSGSFSSSSSGFSPAKPKKSSHRWVRKEKIGQGAQGDVYRCEDALTGKEVAVKIIRIQDLSSAEVEAVTREVRTMKRLHHRHLVQYHKATQKQQKRLCIYMEFVPGGSLSGKLRREGALPMHLVKKYTRQLCQVLQYLHQNRIAHRDIKCANIFLSADSKSVKLGDFGAFKELGSVSLVKGLKGTPHWMAPEVIREQQMSEDGWIKADIWSLGCAILEMLTSHSPWQQYSNPLTAMYQIVSSNNTPTIPSDASEETTSFLQWCLQRNPADRPDTTQLLAHPFLQRNQRPKSATSLKPTNSSRVSTGEAVVASDTRHEKKAPARSVLQPVSHGEEPQWQLKDDHQSCGPETIDLPVEIVRKKAAQNPSSRKSSSERHRQKEEDVPEASALSHKPSHIPRLKPLERVRRSTNQEAEKDDSTAVPKKSSTTSSPAMPSITRGSSTGALRRLPRLAKPAVSSNNSSDGISISPVRLRRISTAPTNNCGRSEGLDMKLKLPPLSARTATD